MGRLSTCLAVRVVLIVFIVIIPALGIIVYDQTNDRQRAREDAVENASRLAHLAASEEATSLSGVARLIATLSLFPGLRGNDPAACQTFLRRIVLDRPAYINMFVVRADGAQFCAATNLPAAHSAKEATWFTRVMQTRAMAMSDYQISLMNGRPTVVLAHPLFDDAGRIERIVAAVVGLEELNAVFKNVSLPRGATLTLTDRHGIVLARTPDAAAWIGRRHAQFPTSRPADADTGHAMHESTGTDGVRRLYTMLPVDTGLDTGLFVTLDVESSAIFAQADRLLLSHLWLLGVVALGTLAVALIGGRLLVLQPVEALRRQAEDRMRVALEVSRVGVWEHNGEDDKVFWSDTLAALHGLQPNGFGGTLADFLACVHPGEQAATQAAIADAVRAQQPTLTV